MTDNKRKIDFSTILASSVHDMKNSLSMVINTLDELTDSFSSQDEARIERLSRLKYETKRLNNHLVQMLTLYKIGNEQYYLNVTDNDVAEFIADTMLAHQELLEQRGIVVELDIPENLIWYFDSSLVAGVVNNVVNNAYRYANDKIRISASVHNDWLVIAVSDNGDGYPAEMINKGVQNQTSISFETGSTGLGLYFSTQVASMHTHQDKQGYLHLDNEGISNGGRFSLFLP